MTRVEFAIANLAKKKGFDEPGHYIYSDFAELMPRQLELTRNTSLNITGIQFISAPTHTELEEWLRKQHGINIIIEPSFSCYNITRICVYNYKTQENDNINLEGLVFKDFPSHKEALEAGILEALMRI